MKTLDKCVRCGEPAHFWTGMVYLLTGRMTAAAWCNMTCCDKVPDDPIGGLGVVGILTETGLRPLASKLERDYLDATRKVNDAQAKLDCWKPVLERLLSEMAAQKYLKHKQQENKECNANSTDGL